ncbi:MAG: hypothetical protein KGQ60_02040 [Planctomycetes bacterium]|nr:hypothetical protein [Planctomycetota bacterium]
MENDLLQIENLSMSYPFLYPYKWIMPMTRKNLIGPITFLVLSMIWLIPNGSSAYATDRDGLWSPKAASTYLVIPSRGELATKRASEPMKYNLRERKQQPYAYGWFGTKNHVQPYRQFGHQQSYTQWNWR